MIAIAESRPTTLDPAGWRRGPRRAPRPTGDGDDLQAELQRALATDALEVWYQPIVRLGSLEPARYEALARWRHPQRGQVPPDRFVAIAERTGLVISLDRWVLRRACAQASLFAPTAGGRTPGVSVNLSARSLQRPDLEAVVDDALATTGLPPERLTLELTETGRIDDNPAAAARVAALRARGVRVSLDDFGSGFADFGYLCRLAVDEVKLDRSLLTPRGCPAAQAAVLGAVINLGRSLGFETVAEGIEMPDQRDLLAGLGCDLGQGYLFGRPAPWQGATAATAAA